MWIWVASLASVLAVSLVSLLGAATLAIDERRLRGIAAALVAFAVGALLGDAFIHLVPDAFAVPGVTALRPSLLILGGMLAFFVLEKLLRGRARRT